MLAVQVSNTVAPQDQWGSRLFLFFPYDPPSLVCGFRPREEMAAAVLTFQIRKKRQGQDTLQIWQNKDFPGKIRICHQ